MSDHRELGEGQLADFKNYRLAEMDYSRLSAPVTVTFTDDWTKESDNSGVLSQATEEMIKNWTAEQELLAKQSNQSFQSNFDFNIGSDQCIQLIGGLDISFAPKNKIDCVVCLAVVHYPTMKVVFEAYKMAKLTTPYKPGFLDFREVPLYISLLEQVKATNPGFLPQLLMLDGNGTLQHRKCGVAVHLGVKTGIPSLGVAKTLLAVNGVSQDQIDAVFKIDTRAQIASLHMKDGDCVAKAIRKSSDAPNFYISAGYGLSLDQAVQISLQTIRDRREGPYPVDASDDLGRIFLKQKYSTL